MDVGFVGNGGIHLFEFITSLLYSASNFLFLSLEI